jgi:hypothetical protein
MSQGDYLGPRRNEAERIPIRKYGCHPPVAFSYRCSQGDGATSLPRNNLLMGQEVKVEGYFKEKYLLFTK